MTSPAITEHDVTVLHGDAREQLATLPAGSVQCVVTSPPYYGLRDYGTGRWEGGSADCDHAGPPKASQSSGLKNDGRPNPGRKEYELAATVPYRDVCGKCGARRVDRQLGLEPSPAEYVEAMRAVFAEVRRVLADDGTLWLNIGDSYVGSANSGGQSAKRVDQRGVESGDSVRLVGLPSKGGLPPKNLLGIPWRLAFALQDDGWTLRNAIIWHKPNAMPESVTDRLSTRYEHVFLFSKSRRYAFDIEAIKVPTTLRAPGNTVENRQQYGESTGTDSGQRRFGGNPSSTLLAVHETRNPGDFWEFDELTELPRVLSSDEAAYIASFIDGEGSICIRRRKTQIQLMLTVVNTHEGVIRWLQERTGMGQVRQREVRNEKWRQVWEWTVTSRQAAQVLYAVLPHFRVKREQALVALYFMETTRRAGGGLASPEYHERRHAMAEDVAALNAGRITRSRFAMDPTKPQTSSAGDVFTIPTSPFPGAHFACMPPELARRCILAGCPADGTVLDPFAGSGTTLMVARKLGRKSIGIELNADYIDIIRDRIGQTPLDFGEAVS